MSQLESPTLIGVVQPNGATIVGHDVSPQPDGSTRITIVARNPEGSLNHEVTVIPAPDAPTQGRAELIARAAASLHDNATFIAEGGDPVAQMQALSRQLSDVIRLVLGEIEAR